MGKYKVNDETIELIEKSLKNIDYNCSIKKNESNGFNWEIDFFNFKFIVYHTGNINFQKIKGRECSSEEKVFLTDLIESVLRSKREVYTEENFKYVQLINDLVYRESSEGVYFDFKREYSNKYQNIVKELMALINNLEDREGYLIFGIDDKKNIVGVSEKTKVNEDDFNNNIAELVFGEGHLKEAISFKDVQYREKKLQIIICNRYKFIPIFLDKERAKGAVKDMGGNIYTRVGGSNIIASYRDMKYLWELHRKRINV